MDRALALMCSSVSRSSGVQSSSCKDVAHVDSLGVGVTYLFGEPFIESIQREGLRNPGFGMTFVASVHTIGFAAVLHEYAVNPKELENRQ